MFGCESRYMEQLNTLINELENNCIYLDKRNVRVSSASVGWHLEHNLKVITQIINALEKSNPVDYKWKFNLTRTLILFVNKIPRGRGRAPKIVQPEGEITSESLKNHFDKTRHMIKKLDTLQANSFFKHPYFGDLNLETTKHFLILHTNHHLKIIKDIIK